MNKPREQLIEDLSGGLEPLKHSGRITRPLTLWFVIAVVVCAVLMFTTGPLRPGSIEALGVHPRFALETLLGLLAIVSLAGAALQLSIPSMVRPWLQAAVPLGLMLGWVGFYVYGLVDPALAPSMAGKRAGCWLDTALIGLPALIFGLVLARSLWPLRGGWIGFLMGLAAGAIPALMMQFACMYVPQHILYHHILPGLVLAPLGALLGHFWLHPR